MSYTITLTITEDSPQGHNIESVVEAEHITREEAALRLLASVPLADKNASSPKRLIGLFNAPEDAALMDEVAELALSDREQRNSQPPRF